MITQEDVDCIKKIKEISCCTVTKEIEEMMLLELPILTQKEHDCFSDVFEPTHTNY